MIEILDKKDCCGCNACGDVCPVRAISFKRDEEGFLYPVVDHAACVSCALCRKVCPQLHVEEVRNPGTEPPKAYAAVHKNLATRFDSTSGGAFSALANVIYRQGGFVGGAVWTEDFSIRQIVTDKKSDLPRLRSSKYAQSDAQGFYKGVKDALKTGRPVLVCGTPCQIAGLRTFLGKIPETLCLVDFICRGNNSPLVFRKYLDWQEARQGAKIVAVKPKNKELGWRNLTTKLTFSDGSIVYDTKETSLFTKGYLETNAYCRPSCYSCPYKGLVRGSDITLADCWGAKALLGEAFDRDLGTSLVLVSSEKGAALLKAAEASALLTKPMDLDVARKANPMLEGSLPPPRCDRKAFFETLNSSGFQGVIDAHLKRPALQSKAKRLLRRYVALARQFRPWHIVTWWRILRANGLSRILRGRPLIIPRSGDVKVSAKGTLELHGDVRLGSGFFSDTPRATRVGVASGGKLSLDGGNDFYYGADIEVFRGGELTIGADTGFNLGATIICGHRIAIGKGVKAGRHVTIRDNNGGHWMNLPGYQDVKPVEIGDHVWLCEGCTIMPGVKIGAGAVIGAKAVVFRNVPPNTLVMGNPASVVCEQVEWKY